MIFSFARENHSCAFGWLFLILLIIFCILFNYICFIFDVFWFERDVRNSLYCFFLLIFPVRKEANFRETVMNVTWRWWHVPYRFIQTPSKSCTLPRWCALNIHEETCYNVLWIFMRRHVLNIHESFVSLVIVMARLNFFWLLQFVVAAANQWLWPRV